MLLHVSLVIFFLGCDEGNPKSQNYLDHNETYSSVVYLKIDKDNNEKIKETIHTKNLFSNKSVVNKDKLQNIKTKNYIALDSWWLYAIIISLFIVIYFIALLMKKQKIILQNLKH